MSRLLSLSRGAPAALLALATAAGAVSAGAVPARAAAILEQSVAVAIRADGSIAEHTRLSVRLYTARDRAAWSPYRIYLDENRTLVDLQVSLTEPGGRQVAVGRQRDARQVLALEVPVVLPGSVLALDYRIEERPPFPSGSIRLGGEGDRIEQLRIEVGGEGTELPGWRWRLDGSAEGLAVAEGPGRVVVTARDLPAVRPPDHSPESLGSVLRYSWGPVSTWQGIGRWYQELLASLPHGAPPVVRKAQEIAKRLRGRHGRRETVEALAAFVRRDVRYVAAEPGAASGGGYRPAAAAAVLARGWGDCKDKSVLLVDLLRAAGVDAYPALLRLSPRGRVDVEFPAPNEFNHLVVAVPTAAIELSPDDPVSQGFLFVDPTEALGSAFWLPSYDQDQDALVVRGAESLLVHTALDPAGESRLLSVSLAATPDGDGVGHAYLELRGEGGATWVNRLAARRREENEADARALLSVALPGATLTGLGFTASERGVPSLRISAQVQIPRLVAAVVGSMGSAGSGMAFQPATLYGTPAPGPLAGRTVPVVLTPGVTRSTWRIRLPANGCRPAGAGDAAVANELGSFRQRVALEGGFLTVDRQAELKSRWIEPALFPALQDLATVEYRTSRRPVRLECPDLAR